jgi:hypothetical protein
MLAPPSVLRSRILEGDNGFLPKSIEVSVSERWDDRFFNADGSLVRTNPVRSAWRYRIVRDYADQHPSESGEYPDLRARCGHLMGWLIVDAEHLGER